MRSESNNYCAFIIPSCIPSSQRRDTNSNHGKRKDTTSVTNFFLKKKIKKLRTPKRYKSKSCIFLGYGVYLFWVLQSGFHFFVTLIFSGDFFVFFLKISLLFLFFSFKQMKKKIQNFLKIHFC